MIDWHPLTLLSSKNERTAVVSPGSHGVKVICPQKK